MKGSDSGVDHPKGPPSGCGPVVAQQSKQREQEEERKKTSKRGRKFCQQQQPKSETEKKTGWPDGPRPVKSGHEELQQMDH